MDSPGYDPEYQFILDRAESFGVIMERLGFDDNGIFSRVEPSQSVDGETWRTCISLEGDGVYVWADFAYRNGRPERSSILLNDEMADLLTVIYTWRDAWRAKEEKVNRGPETGEPALF